MSNITKFYHSTDQPLKPTIIALAPGGHPRATRRCMPF